MDENYAYSNDDSLDFAAAIAPLTLGESGYYTGEDSAGFTDSEILSGAMSEWEPDAVSNGPGQSLVQGNLYERLLGKSDQSIAAPAAAPQVSNEKSATDYLSELAKKLGGNDKAVAALIQGGFGMLGGYSQGKMIEEKMKNDKKARDEEWARKDARSGPGKVAPMKFGLLGQK